MKLVEHTQEIVSIIPGYVNATVSTPDLLGSFMGGISANKFDSASLNPVRELWLQLMRSLATTVQSEVDERKRLVNLVESASGADEASKNLLTSLEKESAKYRGKVTYEANAEERLAKEHQTTLSLEASVRQYEKDLAALREVNDEIMTRLKRMMAHVTRLEIAMEEMEQKLIEAEEAARRAPTPPPASMPVRSSTPSTGANGEASSSAPSENADENGSNMGVVSADAFSDLMTQKEEISRQLEEANVQLASRLAEIESLHEQKRDILKQSSLEVATLRQSLGTDISDKQHQEDDSKLLKEEIAAKGDRVAKLLSEIKELSEAHAAAQSANAERAQREIDDWRNKCERSMAKVKAMEAERERSSHQLATLEQQSKEGLSHLPHLKMLESKYAKEHETVLKLELEAQEKDSKIALLSTHNHAAELLRLSDEVKSCRQELDLLKSEAQKLGASEGQEAQKMAEVLKSLPQLAETLKTLSETQKKVDENAELIATLEAALNDTSGETEKIASELIEKERRIASLLTERVNSASITSQSKRLNSIEAARSAEAAQKLAALEKVVEREGQRATQYQQECARLKEQVDLLTNANAEKDKITVQSVLAIDILKKKLDSMNARIKAADESSLDFKLKADEEKQARARVEEELSSLKRTTSQLKSSNALSSSSGVASGGGDELTRYKKDVALYKSLFNCSLCDRKRQVNVLISLCGHTFCRVCIEEKCLKNRNRKCPKCKIAFGANDVLPVYF